MTPANLRFVRVCAGLLFFSGSALAVEAERDASSVFKAGFAERDISPAIGMEQPGGYGKAYHRAFHDPCKARAAVFDDGKTRVAIVGSMRCSSAARPCRRSAAPIQKQCGIEPASILISASHTHSGGPIGYYLPGEFDDASPLVQIPGLRPDRRAPIRNTWPRSSAASSRPCAQADATAYRRPGRRGIRHRGQGRVQSPVPHEGRLHHDPPRPGQSRPSSSRPDRPTRRSACWVSGTPGAVAGLHCQLRLPRHDRPGRDLGRLHHYLEKTIRGLMGEQAVVVFLPGAAGDVTQVDNRSPYQIKQFGEVSARFVGGRVGRRGGEGLARDGARHRAARAAGVRRPAAQIPRRPPQPEHLARALEIVRERPPNGRRHGMDLRQGDRGPRCPDRA